MDAWHRQEFEEEEEVEEEEEEEEVEEEVMVGGPRRGVRRRGLGCEPGKTNRNERKAAT